MRKGFCWFGLAAAVGGVPAWTATAVAQQKVLRAVPHADVKFLDPIVTTATITVMHGAAIYDTLFSWDGQQNARPQMVGQHSLSADKLTYTLTLRPGLKFHDGTPVTAKDAVASLKRWMQKDQLGLTLATYTAGMNVVDANTFTLTLKEPFAWTEFALGGFAGVVAVIMREKDAMIDPNQAATDSIGSGPFKFNKAEWVPGSKVVYDKNADYVPRSEPPSGTAGGKVVKVDRVEYKVIPEAATQANAIIAGEVDFLDQAAIDIIPTVERNRDIVIEAITPLANYGILRPNHLHPPFNNPKARQALAYLMDQKDYAAAAFGPQKWWRECYSYFICDGPYGTEVGSEAYRKPDLAKAKQLLAEAGYKGEKIVIIGASDLPALNALTQVTTAKLKEIGVNVDLVMSDWGGVVTRRSKKDPPEQGGWHIFHTTWGGAPMASPLTSSSTNTACDGRNWFGWPCDEAANKLRDQFIRAANPAEQKAALEALHKRLWEAFPFVLTGQYVQPQVWRKNVTGVLKANTQVWWNIDKN